MSVDATTADVLSGDAGWCVIHGSMLDVLPTLPENSMDACVCDPPYELTAGGKTGFMGRKWDGSGIAFNVDAWKEVLRVLKPGAHVIAFGGTRTWHRLACAIEDAGFEIRDSIAWVQGQGFPKSLNVSKRIDIEAGAERETIRIRNDGAFSPDHAHALNTSPRVYAETAPATAAAAAAAGYGTAMKPSIEPIVLARKPLSGTVAENWQQYGTGALNIDACRVACSGEDFQLLAAGVEAIRERGGSMDNSWKNSSDLSGANPANQLGRWPPNVVFQHLDECERIGTVNVPAHPTWDTPNRNTEPSAFTGSSVSKVRHLRGGRPSGFAQPGSPNGDPVPNGPTYENELVEQWDCADGCPVAELARQSGSTVSNPNPNPNPNFKNACYGRGMGGTISGANQHSDSGTAARYFPQFQSSEIDNVAPFLYQPKASRSERERGLSHFRQLSAGEATDREDDTEGLSSPRAGAGRTGGIRNPHPTVKPVDLIRWLVRLVTPRGGIVIDPFTGSGSTGISSRIEGFRFIGIELNDTDKEPFVSVARARISWVEGREVIPRESLRAEAPPKQISMFEVST